LNHIRGDLWILRDDRQQGLTRYQPNREFRTQDGGIGGRESAIQRGDVIEGIAIAGQVHDIFAPVCTDFIHLDHARLNHPQTTADIPLKKHDVAHRKPIQTAVFSDEGSIWFSQSSKIRNYAQVSTYTDHASRPS